MADTALETPPVAAPAAAPEPTPAPAPEPKPQTKEVQDKIKAFLDRSCGMSLEDAQKASKKPLGGTAPAAEPTPAPEPAPAAAAEPPAPAAEPTPAPEPKPKRERRQRQPMDEETLARAVGEGVAQAMQRQQPAPAPTPVLDAEAELASMPREIQRLYRNYAALEEMDTTKAGTAEKFLKAVKSDRAERESRTMDYIKTWQKENPGRKYNSEDAEHNSFFEEVEAVTVPDVGISDDEIEDAREYRLKKEAREEALQEVRKRETELDRRVRGVESKETLKSTAADAGNQVAELLKADLDAADEVVKPILEDGANRATVFARETYALINGLIAEDLKNPLHAQVRAVTNTVIRQLEAAEPSDTVDEQGRTFATPKALARMSAAERAQHWTVGHEDVIEFANSEIAKQVKAEAAAEEKKWEEIAKRKGYEVKKAKPAAAPAPVPRTATPPAPATRVNAPSLSSGVKTPVPGNGANGEPRTIGEALYSRI